MTAAILTIAVLAVALPFAVVVARNVQRIINGR